MLKQFIGASFILFSIFASQSTALAEGTLRVSAIPDEAPTELQRKFKPLGEYLEKEIGMKVEFIPVSDYPASVEALVAKKVDLVWFGGFTFVQAYIRSNKNVRPLVQREEDQKFTSVFISRVDSGINQLSDLKGKTLSFGSPSSTSGHLMPRSYLLAQKIDPDIDLKQISFSGAHDATIAAVVGGKVQAGALNASVWNKFVQDKKVDTSIIKVFYTTPPYFDYNWSVRSDLDASLQEKIRNAFLKLDVNKPEDKLILDLQRATKYIPTKAENYKAIESAAKSANLL